MTYCKDRNKANRGQALEHFMRFANERYLQKGAAVISKQATEFIPLRNAKGQVCNVKVENKATVDFLGRYKQYPIAIEAKHTSTDSIRFDAVQPHQVSYMDSFCKSPGTIGLVVVSFGLKRFFAIPWAFWKTAYNIRVTTEAHRTAPATVEAFNHTWDIPKKKSVRMDELLPEWEVSGEDTTYGLHYLKNAENYIIKG